MTERQVRVTHTSSPKSDVFPLWHLTHITSLNILNKVFLTVIIRMKWLSSFFRKLSALKSDTHKLLKMEMRQKGKQLICDALIYNKK